MPPQEQTDRKHLELLSVFHYVLAGFYLLGIAFLVLHYFLMTSVMQMAEEAPAQSGDSRPPGMEEVMSIMVWVYIVLGILALVLIVANIFVAGSLRTRRNRMFALVVSGVNCLNMPLGTALGVCTMIVLLRDSVAASFRQHP